MDRASFSSGRPAASASFSEAVTVWARVAALSFGGPAGQIAVMHRVLVEEKRWIGERRFLHPFWQMVVVRGFGAALEIPVFASVVWQSAILTLAAAVAAFRFKVGMIPLLAPCSALGLAWYFVVGAPPAA